MKQLLVLLFTLSLAQVSASSTEDQLKHIYSLLSSDSDSARQLSLQLLKDAEKDDNIYTLVKTNYILGYITKQEKQFEKSVIYYLEAIRYADFGDYEEVEKDRISLRQNIANTFRNFGVNTLATKYNLEALNIAMLNNMTQAIADIKFNQALVYKQEENYGEAIDFFVELLKADLVDRNRILSEIGICHFLLEDYSEAEKYFNDLATNPSVDAAKFKAKALHNLAEICYEKGLISESIAHLHNAIEIKESTSNTSIYSLFNSYRNIGRYLYEKGEFSRSEDYLQKATDIAAAVEWDANSFEVYKTLSDLYYSTNRLDLGKKYIDLYSSKVQEYIQTQEKLQEKDNEYFELLTKRYFDEVQKQEQITEIMFYSKMISGSLLALLLLVVGYNRFEKIRLRRNIEKELVALQAYD